MRSALQPTWRVFAIALVGEGQIDGKRALHFRHAASIVVHREGDVVIGRTTAPLDRIEGRCESVCGGRRGQPAAAQVSDVTGFERPAGLFAFCAVGVQEGFLTSRDQRNHTACSTTKIVTS